MISPLKNLFMEFLHMGAEKYTNPNSPMGFHKMNHPGDQYLGEQNRTRDTDTTPKTQVLKENR